MIEINGKKYKIVPDVAVGEVACAACDLKDSKGNECALASKACGRPCHRVTVENLYGHVYKLVKE